MLTNPPQESRPAPLNLPRMTHYQKLATLVLRLLAFVLLTIGVIFLLNSAYIMVVYRVGPIGCEKMLLSSTFFLLIGLLCCFLSPMLGRLIGKNL